LKNIRIGDVSLAIGAPIRRRHRNHGIISATGATSWASTSTKTFNQTDAAINPGNSGALVDAQATVSDYYRDIFQVRRSVRYRFRHSHQTGIGCHAGDY
jgi:S1-C subfamily serine protease